jgi:hypothetical protein
MADDSSHAKEKTMEKGVLSNDRAVTGLRVGKKRQKPNVYSRGRGDEAPSRATQRHRSMPPNTAVGTSS